MEVVKYGIIGAGMMGREHMLNLYHLRSQGVAVVCVADPHLPSQQHAIKLAHSLDFSLQVSPCHHSYLCLYLYLLLLGPSVRDPDPSMLLPCNHPYLYVYLYVYWYEYRLSRTRPQKCFF